MTRKHGKAHKVRPEFGLNQRNYIYLYVVVVFFFIDSSSSFCIGWIYSKDNTNWRILKNGPCLQRMGGIRRTKWEIMIILNGVVVIVGKLFMIIIFGTLLVLLCECLSKWQLATQWKYKNYQNKKKKNKKKKKKQSLNSSIGVAFIILFASYLLYLWLLHQFYSSNSIGIVFGSMFLVLNDSKYMDMLLLVESNPTQIVGQLYFWYCWVLCRLLVVHAKDFPSSFSFIL